MEAFTPRIVAFCCDKSGYVAADMAGELGMPLPPSVDIVRVPCAGRVDAFHILQAFETGADGILIFACHEENCQSLTGNRMAKARTNFVQEIIAGIGIEKERLQICNLATNNGVLLARTLQNKFEELKAFGPAR